MRALEDPLVLLRRAVADHEEQRDHVVVRRTADAHRRGIAAGRELARQLVGEHAGDEQGSPVLRLAQFPHDAEDGAEPDRKCH